MTRWPWQRVIGQKESSKNLLERQGVRQGDKIYQFDNIKNFRYDGVKMIKQTIDQIEESPLYLHLICVSIIFLVAKGISMQAFVISIVFDLRY